MPTAQTALWPELPYDAWQDTCTTLQLWTQIVGKIRLAQVPWANHSWNVTLYVTPRGLTTGPMPINGDTFQLEFDFLQHVLRIQTSTGEQRELTLQPMAVAEFYTALMKLLEELGIAVTIHGRPNEMAEAIPFHEDYLHASYDPDYAQRFWRILLQTDRVFQQFRTEFCGKVSPAHFFWGGFDFAVTRFSGRPAPPHPGGFPNLPDAITRDAYSHEVSSAGFWPGSAALPYASFYSYAYPTPAGFAETKVQPEAAFFHQELGEFILPYEAVRTASDPDATLLAFLRSTYQAAADAAGWDRASLEYASPL